MDSMNTAGMPPLIEGRADEENRRQESDLVRRAQAGDQHAMRDLFYKFRERLLLYIVGRVKDTHKAEDISQEVWTAFFNNPRSLRNPDAFRPWLYGIARNKALDLRRREKRENEAIKEFGKHVQADAPSPSRVVEAAEEWRKILEALPPRQREVVELFSLHRFRLIDIAEILRVPVGTVRSRLFHARQVIQEVVGHE